MTHEDPREGSGRTDTRARSFDVKAFRIINGVYRELVFHYAPIDEDTANWFYSIIPRIDSQGRRYIVEITEVP